MKYDYPGGVLEEERPLIERFEKDVLPFTLKHGSQIGEEAMQGNVWAEEIIRRQYLFVEGLPHLRPQNYNLLIEALKNWETRRVQ